MVKEKTSEFWRWKDKSIQIPKHLWSKWKESKIPNTYKMQEVVWAKSSRLQFSLKWYAKRLVPRWTLDILDNNQGRGLLVPIKSRSFICSSVSIWTPSVNDEFLNFSSTLEFWSNEINILDFSHWRLRYINIIMATQINVVDVKGQFWFWYTFQLYRLALRYEIHIAVSFEFDFDLSDFLWVLPFFNFQSKLWQEVTGSLQHGV